MSQSRQPYVTLKQFVQMLKGYPSETLIAYSKMEYYQIKFVSAKKQESFQSSVDGDWNVLSLIPNDQLTLNELIPKLEPLAKARPEAAVTISGDLFTRFAWTAEVNSVLCWQTTMNPHNNKLTVEEFLTWMNEQHLIQANDIFGAAESKLDPVTQFCFYHVGETWLTASQLTERYPKLTEHGTWTKLFTWDYQACDINGERHRHLGICRIPESKMQQHFGAKTKNLIDQLLEESNSTVPAK
jgi:hypothetical protein